MFFSKREADFEELSRVGGDRVPYAVKALDNARIFELRRFIEKITRDGGDIMTTFYIFRSSLEKVTR